MLGKIVGSIIPLILCTNLKYFYDYLVKLGTKKKMTDSQYNKFISVMQATRDY